MTGITVPTISRGSLFSSPAMYLYYRSTALKVLFLLLFVTSKNLGFQTSVASLDPSDQFARFHRLTVNDGISQGLVFSIYQDRNGFMWFCTAGGLDRYDGRQVKRYRNIKGLEKQPIYFFSIIENGDSTFWLAAGDVGLMLFRPSTNSARAISFPESLFRTDTPGKVHHLTKTNDKTLFMGISGKGIVRYEIDRSVFSMVYNFKASRREGLQAEDLVGIIPEEHGRVILATTDQLLEYDARASEIRPLAMFPKNRSVLTIWKDKGSDSVWIGTTHGLLLYRNGRIDSPALPGTSQIRLQEMQVESIFRDSYGTLWMGLEDGVASLHEERETLVYYQNQSSDPSTILKGRVIGIMEDRSENLWFSIHDAGLSRIDLKNRKFHTITNHVGTHRQIASPVVTGICIDRNDNLWIAGSGLSFVDRVSRSVKMLNPESARELGAVARTAKRIQILNDSLLFVLASSKMFLYNGRSGEAEEIGVHPISDVKVNRAFVRRSGSVLCLVGETWMETNPVTKQLIGHHAFQAQLVINCIAEDTAGRMWLGTNMGVVNASTHERVPVPDVLTMVHARPHFLWIGTIRGLYRYDLVTKTLKSFHVSDGMPNDKIWTIAVDLNNVAWVGTNQGLVRVEEVKTGSFLLRTYSIHDGLPSSEFNMGAAAVDSKGAIFMGTTNGIVYFIPDSLRDNPYRPNIVLTDVKVYGVPVPMETDVAFLSHLSMPFDKKVFSVSFAALEFTDPSRNQYSYRLEGYDDKWTSAGTRSEAFFTNLDPGEYRFTVRASNSDNIWNDSGLTITILIEPPFWKTWWFRSISGIAVLVLIGGTIRYAEVRRVRRRLAKLEQDRALERERTRISQDMHDQLGSSLTKITLLSELARPRTGDRKHLQETIQKISDTAREVVEGLDEIVWAVNPRHDTLDSLIAYLVEYISRDVESTSLRCRFTLPESVPDWRLSAEVRHNIFLAIKEALNNTLKHAQATEVSLALRIQEMSFELEMRDNGKGFLLESIPRFSEGITGMKKRIEDIGGMFELKSSAETGTEIRIALKL